VHFEFLIGTTSVQVSVRHSGILFLNGAGFEVGLNFIFGRYLANELKI